MTDIHVWPEIAKQLDGTFALAVVTVRFDSVRIELTDSDARSLHQNLTKALTWIESHPSEPLCIEDMAPGTTFWAQHERSDVPLLFVKFPKWIGYVHGPGYVDRRIDPSTIRDVTPPKEQP